MNLFDLYKEKINKHLLDCEYQLVRANDYVMVGENKDKNPVVIIESQEKNRDGLSQRTKKLSLECNKTIIYEENGVQKKEKCHVVQCYSKDEIETEAFLKLCNTYFAQGRVYINDIIEIFTILHTFFSKPSLYSKKALQGIYAELYTIFYYSDILDLAKNWQNKDKMKFDFSLNENTKLEIKSTLSQSRIHHFKHEQLATNSLNIYVLSYKFREDNDGLTLLNLIYKVLPLLEKYPEKYSRVYKLLFDLDTKLLSEINYQETYTLENMRLIDAKFIPKFNEKTPENVSKAEYDSICDDLPSIPLEKLPYLF